MPEMKILIFAIACHPSRGSEAFVGWSAISALRHEHELSVMTDVGSKKAIEELQAQDESWKKVSFYYLGEEHVCHPHRMIARMESWMIYRKRCREAAMTAKRLKEELHFEIAHHITYSTWRMGSPLAGLGIPWIWGPIGGGEEFPWSLLGLLSPLGKFFEIIRSASTWIGMRSAAVRGAAKDASIVLASNLETKQLLQDIGLSEDRIDIISQAFLSESRLHALYTSSKPAPFSTGKLEIIAGGNLEGRKGVSIALQALAIAKKRGLRFNYRYLGYGPELGFLRKLVVKLGLSSEVQFEAGLQGEEYFLALKQAHVFLLPSLRESAGLTMMEAMAAGCVPVVVESGGPALICSRAGIKTVDIDHPNNMALSISDSLIAMADSPTLWNSLSAKAAMVIRSYYSEEYYSKKINEIYLGLFSNSHESSF